jgi:hypothetical protein
VEGTAVIRIEKHHPGHPVERHRRGKGTYTAGINDIRIRALYKLILRAERRKKEEKGRRRKTEGLGLGVS